MPTAWLAHARAVHGLGEGAHSAYGAVVAGRTPQETCHAIGHAPGLESFLTWRAPCVGPSSHPRSTRLLERAKLCKSP
jgi:hypothetical protein